MEEQYIYDVMMGPGLTILILEYKCFNLVVRYCKYNGLLDPILIFSITIASKFMIRR